MLATRQRYVPLHALTCSAIYTRESNAPALGFEVLATPTTVAGYVGQANVQGD